jgi:hypothetical protein
VGLRVGGRGVPVLELASVRELRVVDLPEEGLPTRPMRGWRGMGIWSWENGGGSWWEMGCCWRWMWDVGLVLYDGTVTQFIYRFWGLM